MDEPRSDYEKLASFRYALRRFLRFSERAAAREGLTSQQHQALLAIEGFPGRTNASVKELAERLQLTHQSVVGLLDRLQRLQLVSRNSGVADRRVVLVALTPMGKKVLAKLTGAHKSQLLTLGPELLSSLQGLVLPTPNPDLAKEDSANENGQKKEPVPHRLVG